MNQLEQVGYTPDEMCSVLEALHDAIRDRLRWTIADTDSPWQNLDFEIARASIDMLVQAYGKTFMTISGWDKEMLDPEFLDTFTLDPMTWDILAEITNAKDWNHVPRHAFDPNDETCPVCVYLNFG